MVARAGQDRQTYRVVRLAGRPIIATPARPLRLRLAALNQYRPITKKRACLRAALRVSAITGFDRTFSRSCTSPFSPAEDFGFQPWLDELRKLLGAPSSLATVIWPQLLSRKRIYVHLMSPSGAPIAFCKIGLDARNSARLRNELDALQALGRESLAATRIPRVLHHDVTAAYRYVVYEPLPPELIPLKHSWPQLAPAVAEISGSVRRVGRAELEGFDWWQRFSETRRRYSGEFLRQIDETVAGPVAVCRVQGDATPSNVFRSKTEIWICDWEFSSPQGPRLTDEVSYYLAANHYQCLIRPVAALAACLRRFAPERDSDSIGDLVLAMAFLCGRNDPRALKLARHWRLLHRAPVRQPDPHFAPTSAPYRLS